MVAVLNLNIFLATYSFAILFYVIPNPKQVWLRENILNTTKIGLCIINHLQFGKTEQQFFHAALLKLNLGFFVIAQTFYFKHLASSKTGMVHQNPLS